MCTVHRFTESIRTPDGSKYSSKREAVDAVNSHFVKAAMTCGAPRADVAAAWLALAGARPPADRSIRLQPFSPLEVFNIITKGVAHKPTKDIYGMSVSLMYAAAAPLSFILSELFNACVREGRYPQTLKNVRVSPLYKGKGKREEINSYRPVSIIPGIAKIFEHGLSARITEFLASTNSLSDRQYAYRAGRSTTDVARETVRCVMEARERRQHVAVIMCDLSKAFDVADHDVLAVKLRHYGFDGPSLALLTDFMADRIQIVTGVDGRVKSKPLKATIGVAQGSSLSNIMFSLLLNDLPECMDNAHILMYADDVAAVVLAPTRELLERRLNMVAEKLHVWFHLNGFLLNVTKTNFIVFNLAGRTNRYAPMNVALGGKVVSQVKSSTFLGFQIDEGLTWELHIGGLCERMGRACFALWRLSATLERNMTKSCYFASVHSLLQYGVELWGRAADWERAFRMQKRAVRAIVRVPWDTPARPIFRALKIMTVPALVIFHAAFHVRKHLDEYARLGDGHNYATRNALKLMAVPRRLAKTSKLVHVMGPAVYNRLPDTITSAPSTQSFKLKLKDWLIDQSYYRIDEFLY